MAGKFQQHNTSAAVCPRCNYDQSGVITSWKDACPLRGQCSECGLELDWQALITRRITPIPWWSVEREGMKWPLRIPLAWFFALRPMHLWTLMRMEHQIRLTRLCVLVITTLACLQLPMSLHRVWARFSQPAFRSMYSPSELSTFSPAELVQIDKLDEHINSPKGYLLDIVWPWTETLHVRSQVFLLGSIHRLPFVVLVPVVFLLIAPAVLFILPATRKRAKVRAGHVVRVWAWILSLAPLAGLASAIGFGLALLAGAEDDWERWYWGGFAGTIGLILPMLLMMIFAWFSLFIASERYLKLQRPLAVSVALSAVGFFASIMLWSLCAAEEILELLNAFGFGV